MIIVQTVTFVNPIQCPECKTTLTAEIDNSEELRRIIEEKTNVYPGQTCHHCLDCNTVFFTRDEFPPKGLIMGKRVQERHHAKIIVDKLLLVKEGF